MPSRKHIAILGSTGSIGTQALEVIQTHASQFTASVLTAHHRADLLIKQALTFQPDAVVIVNESHYAKVRDALKNTKVEVHAGSKALEEVVTRSGVDVVLNSLVGFSGLKPTINAIKAGKTIALANKETLVVAGELIMNLAHEYDVPIIPVDSEHSAIFQCLVGENLPEIDKIILTASGGPFRGYDLAQLQKVTLDQALKHPNWVMGAKITIDSASMMNKGLEVIEAKWLFDLNTDQIEVVVHPQSIIHSVAQFVDGSMKAQMGLPDMRLPIQYALTYPLRLENDYPRFNFLDYPSLTFETIDTKVFKNLALAYEALERKGNIPCVLNAANEISNQMFRNKEIGFLKISELNEAATGYISFIENPSLEDLIETDRETRSWLVAQYSSSTV